jgi:hypothetical protein
MSNEKKSLLGIMSDGYIFLPIYGMLQSILGVKIFGC